MASDNLSIYSAVCNPPPEAIKPIKGGKIAGKSDINPMWRIKTLTEQFGPCGIGWGYTIDRIWTEPGADGEVSAFALIHLWYVQDGKRSDPIPGIGGNTFIAKEKGKLATSDECYKMALTDAISVACKALGIAADVYWSNDPTKYSRFENGEDPKEDIQPPPTFICQCCGRQINDFWHKDGTFTPAEELVKKSRNAYGKVLCIDCARQTKEAMER